MSLASEVIPKPTISARISAPRASARARSSNTMIAAPSPSTMPLRLRENGRQVSGAMTRSASQPMIVPNVNTASVPPVTATSTEPARTMWKATPIAWLAEAHALATVNDGPVMPCSIVI